MIFLNLSKSIINEKATKLFQVFLEHQGFSLQLLVYLRQSDKD